MPSCLGSTTCLRAGLRHAVPWGGQRWRNPARSTGQGQDFWPVWPRSWRCLDPRVGSFIHPSAARQGWGLRRSASGLRSLALGTCLMLAAANVVAEQYPDWRRDRAAEPWWQQQDLWPDRAGDADWPSDDQDWRRESPERTAPRSGQKQDEYRFRGEAAPSDQRYETRGGSSYGGWRFREDPELDALREPSAESGYRFRPPTEREQRRWADEGARGAEGDYRWRRGPRRRLPYGEDDTTFGYSPIEGGVK